MSSATDSRSYALDPPAFGDALVVAGQAIGLREKSRSDSVIAMGEPFSLLSFRWPATVTASLKPSGGQTSVNYTVNNFGFGPIQSAHVRKLLQKLTAALADREAKA